MVVEDEARRHAFNPVHDYLDGLTWDGTPRIDKWLTTYGKAEDSEYTQAVGSLIMLAAVRRARQPGCKFDEMLVLISPKQGTDTRGEVHLNPYAHRRKMGCTPRTPQNPPFAYTSNGAGRFLIPSCPKVPFFYVL